MKKFLPAILLVASLGLIAVGIYGVSRLKGAAETDNQSVAVQKKIQTTDSDFGCGNARRLLDVKTPDSIAEQRKDYEGFTVSFNKFNRTPNWVAWELLGSETRGNVPRHKKFWQDVDVEGCPVTHDYTNSGYDRGHMCPAADQKWSRKAMEDCFALTNIVPQNNSLNTGAWQTLESKERLWAKRDSAILIVSGPIYSHSDTDRIGESGVRVPGAFFKVLVAPYLDKPRGIAFVYPNISSPGNMENYVMTIRDVEKLTGFDFFYTLPDDIEDAVETTASFRDWNRK